MTISVILPNYNHAHFLSDAIDAIYAQTYLPFEVIVIDDASTDNSIDILLELAKKYSTLQWVRNLHNLGPLSAVNRGLKMSQGEYICFCSADDRIYPNFFYKAYKVMEQHPEVALCCSIFTESSEMVEKQSFLESMQDSSYTILSPKKVIEKIQKDFFWIATNTSVYRKKNIEKLGELHPKLTWMADWFLNYQLASRYSIAHIPQPLTLFRLEKSSYSQKKRTPKEIRKTFTELFIEIKKQPKDFIIFIQQSGVLYQQGKRLFFYLCTHPKSWQFFLPAFKMGLRYKLFRGGGKGG